jgi:hypothetical protein
MKVLHEWRFVVLAASLFVVACAGTYSSDPEIKSLQIWENSCFSYGQTLTAINDMIELDILDAGAIAAVKTIREFVGPLCEMETPPLSGEREEIQKLIDAELLKLIKLKRGLE